MASGPVVLNKAPLSEYLHTLYIVVYLKSSSLQNSSFVLEEEWTLRLLNMMGWIEQVGRSVEKMKKCWLL